MICWDDDCEHPQEWHGHPRVPVDEALVDLSSLRVEMADAHPDRGGTAEAFIEGRRRYLLAKGVVR